MNKKFVRLAALLMVFALLTLTACNPTQGNAKLATPSNVGISASGLITWDGVMNATEYVVTIGDVEYTTNDTQYQVASVKDSFTYSVYAQSVVGGNVVAKSEKSETKTFNGTGVDVPVDPTKLSAPTNVKVSDSGLVTWNSVANATSYIIAIGSDEYFSNVTIFQIPQAKLDENQIVTIYAIADGYTDSDASDEVAYAAPYTLVISGASEIKHGQSTYLGVTTNPSASIVAVDWSIVEGSEYATVDPMGRVTAKTFTDNTNKHITVRATDKVNSSKFADKEITILVPPALTAEMFEYIQDDKISFDSTLTIELYSIGVSNNLAGSYTSNSITAMDGTNWYASFLDGNTGLESALYYANSNGNASQVALTFTNEAQYIPIIDAQNQPVTWQESGMYNVLKGLQLSDFAFDETTWTWKYVGADQSVIDMVAAAATPYDIDATMFGLVVADGEIVQVYIKAADDYTISSGYRAQLSLKSLIICGDSVDVPTIKKFQHNSDFDYEYNLFKNAIAKMQALDSYTVTFAQSTWSSVGQDNSGFVETITPDICHFVPFVNTGAGVVSQPQAAYGYKKINDNLYNTYFASEGGYYASRAYAKDFANAKPSFAFSEEIFTSFYPASDYIQFQVDATMMPVASTFYYGVGNDIALYGLFASEGTLLSYDTFRPYINVDRQTGYIIEAGFQFTVSSLFGAVQILYSDFNTAEIDPVTLAGISFETRQVPDKWSQLTIIDTSLGNSSGTTDDVEVNALEFIKTYFEKDSLTDEEAKALVPFFGDALGDTYGFGMEQYYNTTSGRAYEAICFYYDVPLDADYTLATSLDALNNLLFESGFARMGMEYTKGTTHIAISDAGLDLLIYVWRADN